MVDEHDVAAAALALPGVTQGESYGTAAWRVSGRVFLRLHEEPGVLLAWCEDEHAKRSLLASAPEAFSTTAHYDGHPSVLVRLAALDVSGLSEVVLDAYRSRAPKRLLATLDDGQASGAESPAS